MKIFILPLMRSMLNCTVLFNTFTFLILNSYFIFTATAAEQNCPDSSIQEPCQLQAKPEEIRAKVLNMDSTRLQWIIQVTQPAKKYPEPLTVQVSKGDSELPLLNEEVKGNLTPTPQGLRLNSIWPNGQILEKTVSDTNKILRHDTVTRGSKVYRNMGEYLPDFALFNQNAALVTRHTLKGKYIVMNFIFTRCAEPTMCPATMQRMVGLQAILKEKDIKSVQLVSISFDPEYDTPGILHTFSKAYGVDMDSYYLLSGSKKAIHDLMAQFGILIDPKDGTLNHTMATLIIDPKGKILYRKDGSMWTATDFADRLKEYIESPISKSPSPTPNDTPFADSSNLN